MGQGAVAADRGGTAIGRIEVQHRAEPPGPPLRLGARPLLAGREGILASLGARLTVPGLPGPRVAGLGGAGKTSLAVEYAHRHLPGLGACWQFAAQNPDVLAAQFGELAAQLGARELADSRDPVASVHAVLARQQAGWLLIFDNVLEPELVEPFLPPAGPGQVLITTQNQHWPRSQLTEVPMLDPGTAAGFLADRTGDPDPAAALALAEELGGLPLALEQAAAYVLATGTSLAWYTRLLRARAPDLLSRGQARGHPGHVAATLSMAASRLGPRDPAAGLLRLLAFLAPERVPLGLLLAAGDQARLDTPARESIGPLLGDPLAAGDAVATLRRYSLAMLAGDGLIQVHRLVQSRTRGQLDDQAQAGWAKAAAALVESAMPADPADLAAWPACALLLAHARKILDLASDGMAKVALYLGASGNYPAARDLAFAIADAQRASTAFGAEHPETLATLHEAAQWTGWAGDTAAARDQYTALLPVQERVLGTAHPATLATRRNLAFFTGRSGNPARARDQYAALLPVMDAALGPRHPDTLAARHSHARVHRRSRGHGRRPGPVRGPAQSPQAGPGRRAPRDADHPARPRALHRGRGRPGQGPRPVRRAPAAARAASRAAGARRRVRAQCRGRAARPHGLPGLLGLLGGGPARDGACPGRRRRPPGVRVGTGRAGLDDPHRRSASADRRRGPPPPGHADRRRLRRDPRAARGRRRSRRAARATSSTLRDVAASLKPSAR